MYYGKTITQYYYEFLINFNKNHSALDIHSPTLTNYKPRWNKMDNIPSPFL